MNNIQEMLQKVRKQRMLRRVLALLCAVVILFTTNQLKLKADTLERFPDCGYPDHVHDESCFEDGVLT